MSDIGLFLVERTQGRQEIDIKIGDYDLLGDEGAETSVYVSLFSDQRVTDEEKPYLFETKRGWWGDVLSEVEGDQIGSKLWTLTRSKTTSDTLQKHIDYVTESLQWMIDDGFSDRIEVDAAYIGPSVPNGIEIIIQIYRPDGTSEEFTIIWDGQEAKRA